MKSNLFESLFAGCPTGFVNLWCKPSTGAPKTTWYDLSDPDTLKRMQEDAESFAENDVYFSTCPATHSGGSTSRTRQVDVCSVPAFFMDIDTQKDPEKHGKRLPTSAEEAIERLVSLKLPPTTIVKSGHGVHAYWILKKPITIKDNRTLDNAKLALKAFAEAIAHLTGWLDLDTHASEPARVLRVPGTLNYKCNPPLHVTLTERCGAHYNRGEMSAFLRDHAPKKLEKRLESRAASAISIIHLTDEEVIEHLRQNPLACRLLEGKWEKNEQWEGYTSQSDADYALCKEIIKLVGNDADRVKMLFGKSRLADRDKWRQRKDYQVSTVGRAIRDWLDELENQDSDGYDVYVRNDINDTSDGTISTVRSLETISARELQEKELPPLTFCAEQILPKGLALLAAPSKYGKSWLSLDLCLSVAMGEPFLGYETQQAGTLYLALEDGHRRLKDRMLKVLNGRVAPENFHMAIAAATVDAGLPQQVAKFLKEHPNTGLVVVDVLQRVRGASKKGATAYQIDYQDMAALKRIADDNDICVFVVHHTRKMRDESDVYNMISGTNGIMGAADTIWIMQRDKRDDSKTKLNMTGRDLEPLNLVVSFDVKICKWVRKGTVEELEAEKARAEYESDLGVRTIKLLLEKRSAGFAMTATEIARVLKNWIDKKSKYTPATLAKHFIKIAPLLKKYDNIIHKFDRSSNLKKHIFKPITIKKE